MIFLLRYFSYCKKEEGRRKKEEGRTGWRINTISRQSEVKTHIKSHEERHNKLAILKMTKDEFC
ncbi:hypothetical protein [Okeania sp. SIO2B3]|uniref:hypothetical protein n=1 Tax=Okeania sp. SIO2B3 TaxID=2607784 RepID=UPI0013C0D58C|nr:hypothetical protein [Okeania sp. SIO2B3]NET45079.1 hypothetical protein [Okeania sp. SIO2B3]